MGDNRTTKLKHVRNKYSVYFKRFGDETFEWFWGKYCRSQCCCKHYSIDGGYWLILTFCYFPCDHIHIHKTFMKNFADKIAEYSFIQLFKLAYASRVSIYSHRDSVSSHCERIVSQTNKKTLFPNRPSKWTRRQMETWTLKFFRNDLLPMKFKRWLADWFRFGGRWLS